MLIVNMRLAADEIRISNPRPLLTTATLFRDSGPPPNLFRKPYLDKAFPVQSHYRMLVEIIRIGNSRVVHIPQALLNQCGLEDCAQVRVEDGRIILEYPADLRDQDTGFLEHSLTRFDDEGWEW
jgi:antitoxin component of MazEF toxin-antitoxin module